MIISLLNFALQILILLLKIFSLALKLKILISKTFKVLLVFIYDLTCQIQLILNLLLIFLEKVFTFLQLPWRYGWLLNLAPTRIPQTSIISRLAPLSMDLLKLFISISRLILEQILSMQFVPVEISFTLFFALSWCVTPIINVLWVAPLNTSPIWLLVIILLLPLDRASIHKVIMFL